MKFSSVFNVVALVGMATAAPSIAQFKRQAAECGSPAVESSAAPALSEAAAKTSSAKVNTKAPSTKTAAAPAASNTAPAAAPSSAPSAPSTGGASGSASEACNIGYASTNGGTTGGAGGKEVTVTTFEELSSAASAEGAAIITISGALTGSEKIRVSSDKTIVGKSGASLKGAGLYVRGQKNVIIRNFKISEVPASAGDAIGLDSSTNVWVDHMDLSSNRDNGKDFYDGVMDVTHACDWITISNTYFHDHYKVSLVGHSDGNAAEDTGKLHVTYANNHWSNVGSRNPSVRFGTVHVYNNYYDNVETSGVNTRMGAKLLVESTQFVSTKRAITSLDSKTEGTAQVKDVDLGGSDNTAQEGAFGEVPYEYSLVGSTAVEAAVVGKAGATLSL